MLRTRGHHQSRSSFGLLERLSTIQSHCEQIAVALDGLEQGYIAPDDVQVQRYNVKRCGKAYWYNKLAAKTLLFRAASGDAPVKVIHLSKDTDPRSQEAKRGIERRNRLNQVQGLLQEAEERIAIAITIVEERERF
jgi:hypothetical protein